MSQEKWSTSITAVQPNEVRLRGYRIDDLMGETSFSDGIYLALMGELPTPTVSKMIEAILVSSIDHGATPPSALAARTAASTGAPLNAAVACGLLSINRFHGGAIESCMHMLASAIETQAEDGSDIEQIANQTIDAYQESKQRLPGLGHRLHNDDPRAAKLFALATETGIRGPAIELLQALRSGLATRGVDLPINVDGAIAAILVDLKVPSPLANAFFYISRLPGLVAHVYEEQTEQRPMRPIDPSAHVYHGPNPRSIDVKKA